MVYFELLKKVYEWGIEVKTRGLKTRELCGEILVMPAYNCISVEDDIRPWYAIKNYLFAELAWYMSGRRSTEDILPYSKFWEGIQNENGTANSQYGDLVFYRRNKYGWTSFNWALRQLEEDINTRKAIVLYNDREFFYEGNKDLICNQYQQFLIRDNALNCLVALRSSDMIYGLTFNMPWWSFVHQMMYLKLKPLYPHLRLGSIQAFLGSVHIYENKYELVKSMIYDGIMKQKYHMLNLTEEVDLNLPFNLYQEIIPNVFRK